MTVDEVVIGLGGNQGGEPAIRARFERAREALAELGPVRAAPLYRTAPWGEQDQEAFLNSALAVRIADVQPGELIATVLELERLLGRVRPAARWGPRAIDLDVLVWGARVIRTPELDVPHPRLGERRFALAPLVALLGEGFAIPGQGAAGALLAKIAAQPLELIAERW